MIENPPVAAVLDPALRSTCLCLAVPRGARHDPQDRGGLAHVLEHVLMSAPIGSAGPLSEHVERLGGYANADTGLETMLYYVRVLAEDADEVADLLLRAVLEPAIDEGVLDSERAAVLQELAVAAADPADVVQDRFLAALFPEHPLGRPVGGTREEVEALTVGEVVKGHEVLFGHSVPVLAVVGPDLPGPLRSAAVARFAPQSGERHPLSSPHTTPLLQTTGFGWVAIGSRSAARGDNGAVWDVLSGLLGSSPSSVLYRELRGAGLAYSFQSWHRGYLEAGAWRVLIGVEPQNVVRAAKVVSRSLERFAERGPSRQDLDAAVRGLRASILFDQESPLDHARALALAYLPGADPHGEARLAALAAVTADDVAAAARSALEQLVVVSRSTS
ncbi:M16 family metallopeptidase [Umezawaea tangerina]|uniref:Putative Zn-dependent peptidase n=1 Tax=Umezawaea tangerina TaxID=84725 RepID=A0A2T0T4D4_9PSEU|nr:pitrilysin family protein [Umezawaea tangerina]PRY40493.1 putative Zn-dependent peptidase [Umezawaea tangerina]